MGLFKPNIEKLKQKRDVPKLISALNDSDSNIREKAAEALGVINDQQAVEPLIKALNDGEGPVVERAATALAVLGDKRSIEPLVHVLENKGPLTKDSIKKLDEGHSIEAEEATWINAKWYILWAVAAALEKLGWEPAARHEKAWFMFYKGKFDEMVGLEQPVVGALILALHFWPKIAVYSIPGEILMAAPGSASSWFGDGRAFKYLDYIRRAAETIADNNNLGVIESGFSVPENAFIMAMALSTSKNPKVLDLLLKKIEQKDLAVIAGAWQLMIRRGKPETEGILIDVLKEKKGVVWQKLMVIKDNQVFFYDQPFYPVLADHFYNCGNPKLAYAAEQWATKQGFQIVKKADYSGPKWGEGI
jgi:hypothetical protein